MQDRPATPVAPPRTPRQPQAADPVPRRHKRAPASTVQPVEARVAALVAVIAIVLGAIWLDRDRFDPAPASGIVPQPGETTFAVPSGTLAEGDLAPNFILRTPQNEPVELANLRGEVVVLHFWATWCLACRDDVPALNGIDDQDGVTVFGIAVGDEPSRAAAAAGDYEITYEVLVDPDSEVAAAYGATSLPVTVVIDPNGQVQSVTHGPFDPATLQDAVDAASGT